MRHGGTGSKDRADAVDCRGFSHDGWVELPGAQEPLGAGDGVSGRALGHEPVVHTARARLAVRHGEAEAPVEGDVLLLLRGENHAPPVGLRLRQRLP